MIIDTSALIAILAKEPEGESFLAAIIDAPACRMSAASYVETAIVLERFPRDAEALDGFLSELELDIEPVDLNQARLARDAYRRFGKGRHPAGLNYGDCFSYALAKASGETLLFKGNDFSHTDIDGAIEQSGY